MEKFHMLVSSYIYQGYYLLAYSIYFLYGRGTRIRTWINGFKVRCAAVATMPQSDRLYSNTF